MWGLTGWVVSRNLYFITGYRDLNACCSFFISCFVCLFFFWESGSLWIPGCPGTAYVGLCLLTARIKGVHHHAHTKCWSFICLFWDRVSILVQTGLPSLCSWGWPWTYDSPPPVSQVLRLQAHSNVAGFGFWGRVLVRQPGLSLDALHRWHVEWLNIQRNFAASTC